MNFDLNETQEMLRDSARRLLRSEYEGEKAHAIEGCPDGFSKDVWSQIVELGFSRIALPESVGGSGLGTLELCLLAEEIGRAGASIPFLTNCGLAANILMALPEQPLPTGLLTSLASSDDVIGVALIDENGRDERTPPALCAREENGRVTLSGVKQLVAYAETAKTLLVSAQLTDGTPAVIAIDNHIDGITTRRHQVLGGDPRFQVSFDGVTVGSDRILARGADASIALRGGLDIASVLAMAEVVGNCEGIIHLTAEYAKIREQFGRPIGSFQAVSHPIAEMRIQTDACRLLALEAAWLLDQGKSARFEVASAKVFANEAVSRIALDGHRLHGAIGYSNEYDLQLYTRRAKAFCVNFGSTEDEIERAAAALGL